MTLLRFFLILGSVMRAAIAQTGNGLSPTGDGQLRSQKGPPGLGGPSLGRNAPKSKMPLGPVTPQSDRRLFLAVFTQKEKRLRDSFFGTDAVKSVHGFERPRFSRESADFSIDTTSKDGSAPAQLQRPSHRKLRQIEVAKCAPRPMTTWSYFAC
jgi:hypothetical protein